MAWVDDVDYVSNGSMQRRGMLNHESSGYFYEKPYKEPSYQGGLEPEIPDRRTKKISVRPEVYPYTGGWSYEEANLVAERVVAQSISEHDKKKAMLEMEKAHKEKLAREEKIEKEKVNYRALKQAYFDMIYAEERLKEIEIADQWLKKLEGKV